MASVETNRAQFNFQIGKFVEKANGKLREFANEFCGEVSERILKATPVKSGELVGSWKMEPTPGSIELGQKWTMTNTAPYAMRIEFGFGGTRSRTGGVDSAGRHYKEKGHGFVRGVFRSAGLIANGVAEKIAAE